MHAHTHTHTQTVCVIFANCSCVGLGLKVLYVICVACVVRGIFMRPHVDFTSALHHSRDILSEVIIGYTVCVEYFKLVTMYSFKYFTCLFISFRIC